MMQNLINQSFWLEKWPAPAKLNLMLRIVGRRDDGYHLLQTVFQFIDLCDWLTFHPAEDGEVRLVKTIPGVAEEDDLTIRAAKLLKAETGCKLGVRISVEKNLPMGGGLGGGSSDAATTLLVLNKLWGLQLPKEKLLAMGLTLGADVPVFIFGHASWGEGVGECLKEISIHEQWVIVIKPDCHVDTKEIFSDKNLTRNSKSIKMSGFLEGDHQNDCLSVVVDRYPLVKEAINDLMLFAEFGSYEQAKNAYDSLKQKWLVYLTKGTNESPLIAKLNMS